MKNTIRMKDIGNRYLHQAKTFRDSCSDTEFAESKSLYHYSALYDKAKFFYFLDYKTEGNI